MSIPFTHISLYLNGSKWSWASGAQNIEGWIPWPQPTTSKLPSAVAYTTYVNMEANETTQALILCESKNNYVKYSTASCNNILC
jgi:hypothetical protein